MPPAVPVTKGQEDKNPSRGDRRSHTAAGIQSTRDFLHNHNPLHRIFGKSQENVAVPAAEEEHRPAWPKPEVAHLTLEDMVFDENEPVEIIEHEGMSFFSQNNYGGAGVFHSAAPVVMDGYSPAGLDLDSPSQPTDFVDGPAPDAENQDGKGHHHLHQEHDPEHPSGHHHPNHLQAPHTKEEREDALLSSYLLAIDKRTVPDPKIFSPPLAVTCGPLLKYLGLNKSSRNSKDHRETWRGSIMIVTQDNGSDYSTTPKARLFFLDSAMQVEAPNEHGKRGSRSGRSGEKQGKFREISAYKLSAFRGVTFWRFSVEVELADNESRIAYRINNGPLISFWVPARAKTMNIMFHSCNGFSLSVNPADFCGPDPLWKDVLEKHLNKPFHVMIGGGDQRTAPKTMPQNWGSH